MIKKASIDFTTSISIVSHMSDENIQDHIRNDIVFQRAIARSKEAALPIIAGSLGPRDALIWLKWRWKSMMQS